MFVGSFVSRNGLTHSKAIIAVLCGFLPAFAYADYPMRPIRMIVGFAASGGADLTARAISERLSDLLGQRVIVDNRPGAAGNIATTILTRADPDGYTILMETIASLAINPALYGSKLAFDPQKDLVPIIQTVNSTNILSLHPTVPAGSVKELIALAKSKSLNYGSSGIGSTGHLSGVLFATMAGIKLTHVPYKGGVPAIIGLMENEVQIVFAGATSALPQINFGKIKAIAVTTAKRSALMPNIPTIAESGLPGFDANNWYGLVAPAKTPRAIIDLLNRETAKALKIPDVIKFLAKQGLEPAGGSPAQFGAYIKSESEKWAKVIKDSGARAE